MASATPYITPEMLVNAPTGISWETIPTFGASTQAQFSEQTNICWRASHWVDAYCGQVLRATVDTEELLGPDYRLTVDNSTGNARFYVSRWPVTSIVSGRYAPSSSAPPSWTAIPLTSMFVESPHFLSQGISSTGGAGSYAVQITPGYVDWLNGRRGYRVQLQYVNGWMHCGILSNVSAGATTLTVDDCSGAFVWNESNVLEGVTAWIFDGANTELVQVQASSVTTGPGTITLTNPTQYPHTLSGNSPIMFSSMPETVHQACILHASYQALVRGATATSVQNMPGAVMGGGGSHAVTLLDDAKTLLDPYRRVL